MLTFSLSHSHIYELLSQRKPCEKQIILPASACCLQKILVRTCRIEEDTEELEHGNYSRKCEGLGDVMDMEKAAETVAPGKKRKSRFEELEDTPSSSAQLKTRRRLADLTPVNFGSSTCETSSSYGASASCCSRNGSSELAKLQEKENEVTVDQFLVTSNGDTLDLDRRERSETSSEIQVESGELESTARPNESNPHRPEKMPSDDDLEEFFASAEKNLQKQFIHKYNYDIVKDEPLEGRFEWVQIKETKP